MTQFVNEQWDQEELDKNRREKPCDLLHQEAAFSLHSGCGSRVGNGYTRNYPHKLRLFLPRVRLILYS